MAMTMNSLSTKMSDDNDWDKVPDDDIPPSPQRKNKNPSSSSHHSSSSPPSAHQIVSIGTESDQYAFTFHQEALNAILNQIPPEKKVCVVSVVGAFRTGKSFLLSWFLRYLNHYESLHLDEGNNGDNGGSKNSSSYMSSSNSVGDEDGSSFEQANHIPNSDATTTTAATANSTANTQTTIKWYEKESSLGQQGFHWRGGAERNTTGIWMWSKPYILPRTSNTNRKEDIAVLLVDTQGMFDHETTMGLTAAIFGLSTLLSSYQIYNVDKRIQEDNLQQLALFSEYGRMAIQSDGKTKGLKEGDDTNTSTAAAAAAVVESINDDDENNDCDDKTEDEGETTTPSKEKESTTSTTADEKQQQQQKPFQLIEFLVRDWQNFDDEDDMEACQREMEEYLENVLAERDASDLKDTREQITSCFEAIQCYLMPHPGKAVTKKKYAGEIDDIDPTFTTFMDIYCSKVFEHLVAKSIHGRELTALELGAYIQNYAKMFETGAQFPEAATMLEATSNANNTNAFNLTIKKYKDEMETVAGTQQTNYMNPVLLQEFHRTVLSQSMRSFDDIACFGNKRAIEVARDRAIRSMEESFEVYTKLNESRNPLAGFETYIIPLTIGFMSAILRWVTDWTCTSWSQTCRASSEFLTHMYQVVFFFLIIIASTKAKQLSEAAGRLKTAWEAMQGGGGGTAHASSSKKND